ncbi:unnamed protein product, partial [Protopolystoma xenopodis]
KKKEKEQDKVLPKHGNQQIDKQGSSPHQVDGQQEHDEEVGLWTELALFQFRTLCFVFYRKCGSEVKWGFVRATFSFFISKSAGVTKRLVQLDVPIRRR